MRKLLALAALISLSSACAITDYPVITDQDQVRQANGTHVVNTTGRAFIMQKVQVASFIGDTSFNTVSFVNQDQRGNQTLYTHMNIGLVANPDTWFHGTVYMNDDRNTCWNVRAANPVSGDVSPFDFDFNANCKGSEALAVLVSFAQRSQEAGSDGNNGNPTSPGSDFGGRGQSFAGVTVQQAIAALGQLDAAGTYGSYAGINGYRMTVTPANFGVTLTSSAGASTTLAFDGVTLTYDPVNQRALIDPRGSNAAAIADQVANWVDANGRNATLTLTFLGTTARFNASLFDAAHYRALADRL